MGTRELARFRATVVAMELKMDDEIKAKIAESNALIGSYTTLRSEAMTLMFDENGKMRSPERFATLKEINAQWDAALGRYWESGYGLEHAEAQGTAYATLVENLKERRDRSQLEMFELEKAFNAELDRIKDGRS